jgi:hypothetical protein
MIQVDGYRMVLDDNFAFMWMRAWRGLNPKFCLFGDELGRSNRQYFIAHFFLRLR